MPFHHVNPNTIYTPISSLNPMTESYKIKCRITYKTERRYYSNSRGQGSVFSIELVDEGKGEIRGTFFND